MLIDSHAHLDDKRFDKDRDMIIENLGDNGVELVVNIGADIESSQKSVELAKKHENIYAVVGVHPHSAKDLEGGDLSQVKALAREEKVVAIGEIGLDFYYDNSPRDIQRKWFKAQLDLAKELGMPVVVHTRDAAQETFDILKDAAQDGGLKCLLHCYSGSAEMAQEYIKLGFYISLGGPVTFKNARVSREVAKAVPLDRLLIETDSPYLTPEPYRGKRNEPMYVKYVAQRVAEERGITYQEVVRATSENAKNFFGIEGKGQ